jgi:6,7-dimethyl-8-ribityllumazine synthase
MAKKRRGAVKKKPTKILVVEARYYTLIADALLDGAVRTLSAADTEFDVVTVPGALEIPTAVTVAIEAAIRKRRPYDGAVALGCVIQGETFHFDIVAMQSASALLDLSVRERLPVGNGILTVDNQTQAFARSGPGDDNKGAEAARAVLSLIALKRNLAGSA